MMIFLTDISPLIAGGGQRVTFLLRQLRSPPENVPNDRAEAARVRISLTRERLVHRLSSNVVSR